MYREGHQDPQRVLKGLKERVQFRFCGGLKERAGQMIDRASKRTGLEERVQFRLCGSLKEREQMNERQRERDD